MNGAGLRESRTLDKFIIRMPEGWRDRFKQIAKQNRRSVNAEILIHLGKVLEDHDNSATGNSLQARPAADAEQTALQGGDPIHQG